MSASLRRRSKGAGKPLVSRLALALVVASAGLPSSLRGQAHAPAGDSAEVRTPISLHQEIDFAVPPPRVYEALLDSAAFSAFSLFDGHIIGRTLEVVPGGRIVQPWRVVDWPEGVYSIVRFEFSVNGTGSRVVVDHSGFPSGLGPHRAAGWHANYWTLLSAYLR